MASRIYVGALLVHYVVIFEEAFAYAEVVFFHAFLGFSMAWVTIVALDHLALFQAKAVEHLASPWSVANRRISVSSNDT